MRPPTVRTCPGHAGVGSVRDDHHRRPARRGPRDADRAAAADARPARPARPVGEPRHQPAHPGDRHLPGRARPVLRRDHRRDRRRDARRLHAARPGRPGRRRDRRADDGAAARPARPAGVVRADGAQPAAVRRLGDVRDLDHLLRRARGLGRPPALAVRARRRRRGDRDGAAPARLGPAAQADRGGRRGRVERVLPARDRPPPARRPDRRQLDRLLDLDGPGDRAAGVLDPAGRGLLAVLPVRPGGRDRHRRRLRAVLGRVLPARRARAARVRDRPGQRRGRRAARRAGRCRRAGHPRHGRGGRGLREHLLDRHQRAERRAPGGPAAARPRRRRRRDRARPGGGRRCVRAVPLPHRRGLRAAGRDPARRLRAVPRGLRHLRGRAVALADAAALGRRLRRLPAHRADDPGDSWPAGRRFWRDGQDLLGISATNGFSASLVALAVAGLLTLAVRARRPR